MNDEVVKVRCEFYVQENSIEKLEDIIKKYMWLVLDDMMIVETTTEDDKYRTFNFTKGNE